MESHYEINVSLDGRHIFATASRSATTLREARRLFRILKEKFTGVEGFQLSITRWDCKGTYVTTEILEAE